MTEMPSTYPDYLMEKGAIPVLIDILRVQVEQVAVEKKE